MGEFIATSGSKVIINAADFEDAILLKEAIERVVSTADFAMPVGLAGGNISDLDIDVVPLAKLALLIDGSPKIRACIFKCLSRCLRDGEKITMATFENEGAREDYYEIVIACVKRNLKPFMKALVSQLSPLVGVLKANAEFLKQK